MLGINADSEYWLHAVIALFSLLSWRVTSRLISGYNFDQTTVSATLESIERCLHCGCGICMCYGFFTWRE